MKVIDLFSGIGGFSLAGHWAGHKTIQFCERDPYCQKVLKKRFPSVPICDDIFNFGMDELKKNKLYNPTNKLIVTAGFPCQPFSTAGKRKGENDERHLWPEVVRILTEVKPAVFIGENVAGLTSMDDGRTLDKILSDLEGQGLNVETFLVPACGVGARHRRERIWIVAYTNGYLASKQNGKATETERGRAEH